MPGLPAPIAETLTASARAAVRYPQRVKPGLDLDAADGELVRLHGIGEISARERALLGAASPAAYDLLIGDAIVLPRPLQAEGGVATTRVTRRTPPATRREMRAARTASLAACKRAQRRARS